MPRKRQSPRHCRRSNPQIVGAPILDRALDVAARFQLSRETATHQVWNLIVRGEAKSDVLPRRQLVDLSAHVGGKKARNALSFLETDDPILREKRHIPREKNAEENRQRDEKVPRVERPVERI